MDLVRQASVKLGLALARSLREGDGTPVEADDYLNDTSREVVESMVKKHGKVFLGRFNTTNENPQSIDVLWTPSLSPVLNFEADFVVPTHDQVLVKMLLARLKPGCAADSAAISLIQNRIREIGGELLFWS